MAEYGLRIKSDAGNYLITEQTTNLSFVKKCIGFDEENTFQPAGSAGHGTIFRYEVTDCPGTPIPFFTAPIVGKLYSITQVFPTGTNKWGVELITNTVPDSDSNFSIPSIVAVPPTGFSNTLSRYFKRRPWETPIYPVSDTTATIQNVSIIQRGWEPQNAYTQFENSGISRGSYIMCHDSSSYNTSTGTYSPFTQDLPASNRRIRFNNVLKSGDFLTRKDSTANTYLGFMQFDGGYSKRKHGTNYDPAGIPDISGGSGPTGFNVGAGRSGAVKLMFWSKLEGIGRFDTLGSSAQTDNTSDYIGGKTRLYIREGDYEKVVVGMYVDYIKEDTFDDVFSDPPTANFWGWQEIVSKGYDSSNNIYYMEINGNKPGVSMSFPWYELRNQDEDTFLAEGQFHDWFYYHIKGFPGASTNSPSSQFSDFTLTSDYTTCNTSYWPVPLDGRPTPFSFTKGPFPAPDTVTFPDEYGEDYANRPASNSNNPPTLADDRYEINDSTTIAPVKAILPIAAHGGNWTRNEPTNVSVQFSLFANFTSSRHYLPGHTINRKALIKGETNHHRINIPTLLDKPEYNTEGTSLPQDNANRLRVTDTPVDYLDFNQSFSIPRTQNTTYDLRGFMTKSRFDVPTDSGNLTMDNGVKFILHGTYMTYAHNVSTSALGNNEFTFKSATVYQQINVNPFTYGYTYSNEMSSPGFTVVTPTTDSSDSKHAKLVAATNNTIDTTNWGSLSQECVVKYEFYVKPQGEDVQTKEVHLVIKRPPASGGASVSLQASYTLHHEEVTRTNPYTSFVAPAGSFALAAYTDNITGTRTYNLYQVTVRSPFSKYYLNLTGNGHFNPSNANTGVTQLISATLTTDNPVYYYTPVSNTSWHGDDLYDALLEATGNTFTETMFILQVVQNNTVVAETLHTHTHSRSPQRNVTVKKYFDTGQYIQADDQSMWKHDGFRETPNTVQTRKRGFVPCVGVNGGTIDMRRGTNIEPFYLVDQDTLSPPRPWNNEYAYNWKTMHSNGSLAWFNNQYCVQHTTQMSYEPAGHHIRTFSTTDFNDSPPVVYYNSLNQAESDKWTFTYVYPTGTGSIRPDQVTLDNNARGLLRANYGYLNSGKTIRERLIWKGQTITTSSTIGGISNPYTDSNGNEYSFDFESVSYTEEFAFIPVSKVGAYDANDFDGFGPDNFDSTTIPELYIFSNPGSAPTPHDPEGLQVRDSSGIALYDSRTRPLLVTDVQTVQQPTHPTGTIDCSALPADSSKGFTDHSSALVPTEIHTQTLTSPANPAYFYNTKTMGENECHRVLSEGTSVFYGTNFVHHNTKYWGVYRGGIGRINNNTSSVNAGYIVVDQGAYYSEQDTSTYVAGLTEFGQTPGPGGMSAPFQNSTINNAPETAISIDTSIYDGTTYTVTTSSAGGTAIQLSGSDRNGSFNNAAQKSLTLRTGDRLVITFHTSNYFIRTALTTSTSDPFLVNSATTVKNNGTTQAVHFVPDKPGTYHYTRAGISQGDSMGVINVTTA